MRSFVIIVVFATIVMCVRDEREEPLLMDPRPP